MGNSGHEVPAGEVARMTASLGEAVRELNGSVDGLAHYVSTLDHQRRSAAELARRHEELAGQLGNDGSRLAGMLRATSRLLTCQGDLLDQLRRRTFELIATGGQLADGTTELLGRDG